MSNATLAELVLQARTRLGLTIESAALACNLSVPGYRAIERGTTRTPHDGTQADLCRGLKIARRDMAAAVGGK